MADHIEAATSDLGKSTAPPASTNPACDDNNARAHFQYMMGTLTKSIGTRYANCRMNNFEITNDKQRSVVGSVKAFVDNLKLHVERGTNLLLYGPAGTGKDHLLTAVMAAAIYRLHCRVGTTYEYTRFFSSESQPRLLWRDGFRMFSAVRNSMAANMSYHEIIDECATFDILAMSDPLPVTGGLTVFQRDILFEILDQRYRNELPTWITCNVAGRDELEERLGVQNADRLRDGAVALHCDWDSYRTLGPKG